MIQDNMIDEKYSSIELRAMFEQFKKEGLSHEQMAEKLSVSLRTVARYIKKFGLSHRNQLSLSVETVAQLYDDGLTANEIAKKFGVSHDAITRRLHQAGREINRASNIEKHFVRVHDAMWGDIEHDLNGGLSKTMICAKYHLRPDNLEKLMKRKQYHREFVGDTTEIESILASSDGIDNPKAKAAVKLYLTAVLDFVRDYKCLPTATSLANYMNLSVQTVAWWFKKHDYSRLLAHNAISSQVSIVEKTLSDLSIAYVLNNRKIIPPFEIDLWLYDLNIGIEINPSTAHCINPERKMHKISCDYHQKKALECWHKNIRLIQLYDWDIFQSNVESSISAYLAEWTNFGEIKEVTIDLDKPFCHESDLLKNGFTEIKVNPPLCRQVNANTNRLTNEQNLQTLYVYNSGSITYMRK